MKIERKWREITPPKDTDKKENKDWSDFTTYRGEDTPPLNRKGAKIEENIK